MTEEKSPNEQERPPEREKPQPPPSRSIKENNDKRQKKDR